jgi:8-oxo-dGTP pyrophosphatase MutT (NUDIX family)
MEKTEHFIRRLNNFLGKDLPGPEYQDRMAPDIRPSNIRGYDRHAAVMILLYPYMDQWYFVLMKRPEYPGVHSNQVSLPGGMHEDGDPDLEFTALRETREELGIEDSRIRVLGSISKLHIPVSGIEVTPFVGEYPVKPEFQPDPAEVSYLIEAPLRDLLSPEKVKEDTRTILGNLVRVPYFDIKGEQVWGATAMILSEFLEIVSRMKEPA